MTERKIQNLKEIQREAEALHAAGKKIVLALGHFNVIHPGHQRFLRFAKSNGDFLLLAVLGDSRLDEVNQRHFYKEEERARSVSELAVVDRVIILNRTSFKTLVQAVRPHFYVKGKEFEQRSDLIADEIQVVEAEGGKVIFDSGDIRYANAESFTRQITPLQQETRHALQTLCERHKLQIGKLKKQVEKFSKCRMLVIGDSIVDQFIACDALGMSSEAPVLAIRELETKEFIGGAAIVACHVNALSAESHFISVVGDDDAGRFLQRELTGQGIDTHLFVDERRPTTFKIRYMVDNQKLLRVSRLTEKMISREMESLLIERLRELMPRMDGVILCDFVYGVLTPAVLEEITALAREHGVKLFGDLQCSSQVGNVAKFKNFDLLTPTEREARIALGDNESGLEKIARDLIQETNVQELVITLGENGLLVYQQEEGEDHFVSSQHFPAFVSNPVDVAGAGDSLLSGLSLSLCVESNLIDAALIGNSIAAICVGRVGNIPVTKEELLDYLHSLEKQIGRKVYRVDQ